MPTALPRILVIGATSAIAEHCARRWMERAPVDIHLVGRDLARLDAVAADLRVRNAQGSVTVHALDSAAFADPVAIAALVASLAAPAPIDVALVAHGNLPDQKACEADLALARDALEVNAISPALFAEAIAGRMAASGRGTLGLIGSVAGDRGRKSNYVYGAAKGLLARYAQGLQHRLAGSGVRIVLVKPGPTATPMTAALAAKGARLASVSEVADAIVAGMDAGKPVVYAPARWWLVMQVIRHLPRFVFNRMDI